MPPITLIPANPRTYCRGRSNYVDGSAEAAEMEARAKAIRAKHAHDN